MGRYRLGDIIKMTRKSLSITQEQLSDDICSVETLSRIETGKQNPSRDVYELLMERMGRIRDRAYSMLSVSDFKVLEKMKLFEDCIQLYDYHGAEAILMEIKKTLGNTNLDRQFLIRADSLVNYRLKRISTEEFLYGLQRAIRITIPKYGKISLSNWPLNYYEAVLLINISTAYAEKKDIVSAIKILEDANIAMKQSYIEEQQRVMVQVTVATNLSKWYGLTGNHEKAIEIAQEGILICKDYKIGKILPHLLYNYVWNKERLIEKGVLSSEYKRECMNILKQAYFITCAMQQPYMEQFLESHIFANYSSVVYHNIVLDD